MNGDKSFEGSEPRRASYSAQVSEDDLSSFKV
jgi:hypothetical protein